MKVEARTPTIIKTGSDSANEKTIYFQKPKTTSVSEKIRVKKLTNSEAYKPCTRYFIAKTSPTIEPESVMPDISKYSLALRYSAALIEERIKDRKFSGGFRNSIMNIRKPIEFWCNYKN